MENLQQRLHPMQEFRLALTPRSRQRSLGHKLRSPAVTIYKLPLEDSCENKNQTLVHIYLAQNNC